MKENELLSVALRQRAVYLPGVAPAAGEPSAHVLAFVAQLRQLGYAVSEPLLRALCSLSEEQRQQMLSVFNSVMGVQLNWASLVRGWLTPTGESRWDHFVTFIANAMRKQGMADMTGTTLPCGHFIPDGTFPLERYNGCPYCGTPFHLATTANTGQGADEKLRLLSLWTDADLDRYYRGLLASPVPLSMTETDSLKTLLRHLPLPQPLDVPVKETRMVVVDALVEQGRDDEAAQLFASPTDVLRYLWYRHTGHLQLIEPRTLLRQKHKNLRYELSTPEDIEARMEEERRQLRLKFTRQWCRRAACWLNALSMPIESQLEAMHPKRKIWVRMIRALRLPEHARRPGFGQLQTLLDRFYRQDYEVWQGKVNALWLQGDGEATLQLLRQRPGLFARNLFAAMLWFGPETVLTAFRDVIDQLPVRLFISLGASADIYFDREARRVVRPVTGVQRTIGPHPLLDHYTDAALETMKQSIRQLYLDAMRRHFAQAPTHPSPLTPHDSPLTPHPSPTIYIDPQLDTIPVSVGDRSTTVQDISAALQGQRFPVSGDAVRLFLQWGKDLPAQHLDMDLSCHILTDSGAEVCSYFNLAPQGARHSGDIQHIPDRVGTAEYIELSLPELEQRGARRVVFTCNAYTAGALSPNLVVGWMSAEAPMTVSDETGVAYDPSTVDHFVRITEPNLAKGLIFGVLDVARREITWLEMPFDGQTVLSISPETVDAYLRRLALKPTLGQVLRIKAEAQHLTIVDAPDAATEVYTQLWAQDASQVNNLLFA